MQTHLFSSVLLAGAASKKVASSVLLAAARPRAGRATCSAGGPRGGFGVLPRTELHCLLRATWPPLPPTRPPPSPFLSRRRSRPAAVRRRRHPVPSPPRAPPGLYPVTPTTTQQWWCSSKRNDTGRLKYVAVKIQPPEQVCKGQGKGPALLSSMGLALPLPGANHKSK